MRTPNKIINPPHENFNAVFVMGIALVAVASMCRYSPAAEKPTLNVKPQEKPAVQFLNDVVPLLTRLQCNSGGCHGKVTGQNGFKLSLLGFEPELDHAALVQESRGRRLFPGDPSNSLLLTKATGVVPHGGGRRLNVDSDDYRMLLDWIASGAPGARPEDPQLIGLDVTPQRSQLKSDTEQQLRVVAHFSDGSSRDVTRRSVYETNAEEIAEVDQRGLISTKRRVGLFAVMVRFGDQIGVYHGAVPHAATAVKPEESTKLSKIDRHLRTGWQRLGITPSKPADDATFIRRASLDICGTLPTATEVTAYLNDTRPDKRRRLIDRLLKRPEYATYFALKWADILQNRGRGYSTRRQRTGTTLFSAWIRDSIAANKPYDQFASEILTASGSQRENPPTIWYRSVRTTQDYVESVAQAFLGVRIQCAQCHHHPAERWSQADYYGLAAVFSRVGRKGGFADAEVPTNQVIYLKREGEVRHPRTGVVIPPRPLGGPNFDLSPYDDPRRSFASWMTATDNPYFARTMANRMWGHFMGRGIIHPIDDARSTNPPSNPELFDELANEFIASGYNVKHLIRVITTSSAYGLSSIPNETNKNDSQSFARFYPRRLPAEVLLDGMSQVLDVPTKFSGGPGDFPVGTRAIALPDENVPMSFLDVFGRPARTSACECERSDAPALAQALELVNSAEIQRKLTAKDGTVARLAANDESPADNIRQVFLTTLARPPSEEELSTAVDFVNSEEDRSEAYRSLLWSLMATNEFLLNH
ncbi:MAG: DUF1549 domain-containing protein [Planctomycetaceae bacterium]|nr:DUF1549 domain-containing protein [Planctomycetaceae bacterium]